MLNVILPFLKNKYVQFVVLILLAFGLGALTFRACAGPRVTVVERPGAVQERVVYVDKPVLTEKIVTKYVTDRAEVQKVLMENAYLENQVTHLNETITVLKAGGAGQIVYVDKPVPGETRTVREATFKDWRLDFKAVDTQATYTLNKKFETISTVGKDKQGKPFVTTKVLEVGPGDTKTLLTNTNAVTVIANTKDGKTHWFFTGSVQGGFAFATNAEGAQAPGGVVGLKWLTKGYTKSAEDGVFALATPVVYLTKETQEVGVLPVSFNVGRIPKQPFRDLWVSPLLTFGSKGLSHYGAAIVATF